MHDSLQEITLTAQHGRNGAQSSPTEWGPYPDCPLLDADLRKAVVQIYLLGQARFAQAGRHRLHIAGIAERNDREMPRD